jgi:hypothetical protein
MIDQFKDATNPGSSGSNGRLAPNFSLFSGIEKIAEASESVQLLE